MLENMLVSVKPLFMDQPYAPDTLGHALLNNPVTSSNLTQNTTVLVGTGPTANRVRSRLYSLQWRFEDLKLADLGNLSEQIPENEKGFALSELVAEILEKNCTLVIIGMEEQNAFDIYHGFRNYPESIEMVNVSDKINLEEDTVWQKILTHKPANLFNLDFMATQGYNVSRNTQLILDRLYFENHRLGTIREQLYTCEPVLRSAHTMLFDLAALRCTDAPACGHHSPNGLYSEEAAGIMRYAGISNKLRVIGIYGGENTPCNITETLLAQSIWYIFDGIAHRYNDHPTENHPDFIIYRNKLISTGHEIVFYKSKKSNRWWMQIPHPYEKTSHFIGCNYADYETVHNDEMPDRWWRAYQRLM